MRRFVDVGGFAPTTVVLTISAAEIPDIAIARIDSGPHTQGASLRHRFDDKVLGPFVNFISQRLKGKLCTSLRKDISPQHLLRIERRFL
jgi:hypothetical protein